MSTSCSGEMDESADVGVSLASLSDFLSNVYVSVDCLVEVLVLRSRADEVDNNIRVLDRFIVESVVIEIEVTHNVALATSSAEFQFLHEIIVRIHVIMWEDHITSDVAESCTNLFFIPFIYFS